LGDVRQGLERRRELDFGHRGLEVRMDGYVLNADAVRTAEKRGHRSFDALE